MGTEHPSLAAVRDVDGDFRDIVIGGIDRIGQSDIELQVEPVPIRSVGISDTRCSQRI